jgi:hypothetical protein
MIESGIRMMTARTSRMGTISSGSTTLSADVVGCR